MDSLGWELGGRRAGGFVVDAVFAVAAAGLGKDEIWILSLANLMGFVFLLSEKRSAPLDAKLRLCQQWLVSFELLSFHWVGCSDLLNHCFESSL